ncbi:MAG: type II secretion system minor pseudopilin GspK [Nitrospiria bacterium]
MSPSLYSPMKRLLRNKNRNQDGFALLLTLLVVFLLVVIILEADFQARADLRAAGNFRDDLKAFYLARSAIWAGEALLKDDAKGDQRDNKKYDGLDEDWASDVVSEFPLGDGVLNGSIVDESRKININKLVKPNRSIDTARKAQLERLFEFLEIDPEGVDQIIKWLGADAENAGGSTTGSPVRTFETIQELHLVNGMSDGVFRKISPYLTVYGDGKINVNTSDSLVLQSLDEGIGETEAQRLMENRPYTKIGDFKGQLQAFHDVNNRMITEPERSISVNALSVQSTHFSLTAEGRVNDTKKIAYAIINRPPGSTLTKLLYFRVE